MAQNKYYKISPEWAEKLRLSEGTPVHPDGWFLILPTHASRLLPLLPVEEYGEITTIDEAVTAIGGCIYTDSEAIASERGVEEYMMNRQKDRKEEIAEETTLEKPQEETVGAGSSRIRNKGGQ